MDDLRIPVMCKEVAIELGGGTQAAGMVYLPAGAPGHTGAMRLVEWLNGPEQFFPFRLRGEIDTIILNKENLLALTAYHDRDSGEYDEIDDSLKCGVSIDTLHGSTIEGKLVIDMPHNRNRALDVLNGERQFIFLLDSGKEVHINKRFIVKAVETETEEA
ncbi:MAG: hypothetical protein FWB85_09970 [Chitinispirillia bacterium]|nr:hypothetical protein [Chitinispirillia bacterium]MCL2242524.1 hypothetical protein [Chitinispirillia bacterium]